MPLSNRRERLQNIWNKRGWLRNTLGGGPGCVQREEADTRG